MIANKYKLLEKINEGNFGTLFTAENYITKEKVAIKFENKNNYKKSLKNEAKIYQYLGKIDGFSQLKIYGSNESENFIVLNLLGNSLSSFISYYKAFSLKTVLLFGIQIISRIKILHDKFLLHRDLKPSNFLFGLDNESNKLFLIDFGFSKRYNYEGSHIKEKSIRGIIGSINFCSLNIHNNIEPSRRDDLESCIYIILTMLFGKLEWFDKSNIEEIYQLKKQILNIEEVPSFLKIILYYIRSIKFDEKPDYNYIINLMIKEFELRGFINDNKFEWN